MEHEPEYGRPDLPAGLAQKIRVHHFGEVTSALDMGWELAGQKRLEIFDSVVVKAQTRGRGQMRRQWYSPPGNLYVAIRLPAESPFTEQHGAIAAAGLFLHGLENLGCKAGLKWPNDIVVNRNGKYAKCGGILLEERNNILLAGFGLNLASAPPVLNAESLSAAVLGVKDISPAALWFKMLPCIYGKWSEPEYQKRLGEEIREHLVWQGERIKADYGEDAITGIFRGLSPDFLPLVESNGNTIEVKAANIRLAQ